MKPILFLATTVDKLPNGRATGLWLSEYMDPLKVFEDKEIACDIATKTGERVAIDPASLFDVPFPFLFNHPKRLAECRPYDYSAIYCCGGHGAIFDFPDTNDIINYNVVAAVCHGVSILIGQQQLCDEVSCFTNQEELASGIAVPFSLEDKLLGIGYSVKKRATWAECVSISRNIITGQNPASATRVAELLVALLESYQSGL